MADKKASGYDLEGARKAQISDEDSLQHLAQIHNYDLAGAREAGISDQESLLHLATLPTPAAEVYEKESPEFFGGLTGAAGAVTAAGDVLFSKGRPLFRAAEKMIGLPQDPNLTPAKQRKFLDPAQVTERAIATREAQMAPTATEKYMTSGQFTSPEAKALYYGTGETGEYSGARKAAARAIETEKMFPGIKVLPGETPIALPEGVTSQVEAERAEAKRLKDIEQQKEINQLGAKRARLLDERNRLARLKGGLSSADVVGSKVAAPILGGYELGSQGAQAYNRLTREDLQASDVAAGVANIAGAGAGASAMLPGRLRLPKAVISTGLGRLADVLDVRNPRKEKSVLEENPEKKAAGGKVGALSELLKMIKKKGGVSEAQRLERAADLVPNLERQYQSEALQSALMGDNARALMVMKPGDFEKYAYPISAETKISPFGNYGIGKASTFESYDQMPKGSYQDYINYLSQYAKPEGGGFSSVPFLQLGQDTKSRFPRVMGHEGRHRTAALEKLGDESTLVQMLPRASLREEFPRRSQEEYLEALIEKIGKKPMVRPEVGYDGKETRGLIELPEMFKEGGSATPAWQRSEGKNPEGGLNALGRASYKRETGGELKPPVSAKEAKKSPKKASRRKSFCSRMKGMKSKLTSAKTANDPDSRINKALRKWDC